VTTSTEERVIASCSFCLKPSTQVGKLVGGPGVYICNDCVGLCVEVLKQPVEGSSRVAPWEMELTLDQALAHLPLVATAAAQVDEDLLRWVQKARSLGATWERVGAALGVTRQSAWERFSDPQKD
jgi:hypothetical protein